MAQKTIYRISAMPQHGHIGCKTAHSAAKGQSYWWNTVPGPAAVVSVCFNTATASCRCTVSDAHSSQGWHRQQVVHLQDTHRDEVKEKANNQQQLQQQPSADHSTRYTNKKSHSHSSTSVWQWGSNQVIMTAGPLMQLSNTHRGKSAPSNE
jgi:hypothetical protein